MVSVSANTYGTVAKVEARIGDLVLSRTFSVSTTPTLAQVEGILDDVAAQMNSVLDDVGFTAPIVSASYPSAYSWASAANSAGAAAVILNMLPGQALSVARVGGVMDEDFGGESLNRRSGLMAELNSFLKAVRSGRLRVARSHTIADLFKVGSAKDADGNTNLPTFTRAMDDYPGSVSRTEA